jgi:uncharacterized membrane protein
VQKGRLEAFSDGVIAIIITIMVLELRTPRGFDLAALEPLIPIFTSYLLSFVFVGIYWNAHHHLLHATEFVNGRVLWANLHFLFWLSLMPFVTNWMSTSGLASWPVAIYGVVLLFSGGGYYVLSHVLIHHHGPESTLRKAMGLDFKGVATCSAYFLAIPLALFSPRIACCVYVCVAFYWLLPDRRIEAELSKKGGTHC